jgi:hypothetical protein
MVWWAVIHGDMADVWWPSMRFNKKLVALIQRRRWKCLWPMKQIHHHADSFIAGNVLYILIVWWAVSNGGTGDVWLPSMGRADMAKALKMATIWHHGYCFFGFSSWWYGMVMGVIHAVTSKDISVILDTFNSITSITVRKKLVDVRLPAIPESHFLP